jgi:hypothetical protein
MTDVDMPFVTVLTVIKAKFRYACLSVIMVNVVAPLLEQKLLAPI